MHCTIKQIAELCGVSTATVSRAFSKGTSMKKETREFILKTAAEHGYTPSTAARSLRLSKPDCVGVLIRDSMNPFFAEFIHTLQTRLYKERLRLVVGFVNDEDASDAVELIAASMPAAVIVFPDTYKHIEYIKSAFSQIHIQVFAIYKHSELPSFYPLDSAGTETAVKYLIEKGHKRILFFGDRRVRGYRSAYKASGLEIDESLIFEKDDIDDIIENLSSLLEKTGATAAITLASATDRFVRSAYTEGIRIPEDVSLVAYDDSALARSMLITTMVQPTEKMVEAVVLAVLRARNGEVLTYADSIVFETSFLKRNSVKSI